MRIQVIRILIIVAFLLILLNLFYLQVIRGGYFAHQSLSNSIRVVPFEGARENFRKMRKASVHEVIDNAITRTMSRTIITHAMTQTMVLSMLFFGGEVLHNFALALTIGILFGIYSSVLVASPIVMWLGISREDLIKPEKIEDPAEVLS